MSLRIKEKAILLWIKGLLCLCHVDIAVLGQFYTEVVT